MDRAFHSAYCFYYKVKSTFIELFLFHSISNQRGKLHLCVISNQNGLFEAMYALKKVVIKFNGES